MAINKVENIYDLWVKSLIDHLTKEEFTEIYTPSGIITNTAVAILRYRGVDDVELPIKHAIDVVESFIIDNEENHDGLVEAWHGILAKLGLDESLGIAES